MDFLGNIDFGRVIVQYVVLLLSLCVHEAAHAWMADRQGDYTARALGRVSLNPLVHVDFIGTVLFPLLQLFSPIPLIGWAKPVPVNPANLRNPRKDHMLIAAAGPITNLILGTACILMLLALKTLVPDTRWVLREVVGSGPLMTASSMLSPLVGMLLYGVLINFALALFNLIPIPPLDGNWILAGLLPYNAARVYRSLQPYGFVILYGLMFLGLLRVVFAPVYLILGLIIFS